MLRCLLPLLVIIGLAACDSRGPETKGKWLCGEGMSRLEFRDGKVSLEIDYWNGPQGMCDDWRTHFETRKAMSPEQRGAISGS